MMRSRASYGGRPSAQERMSSLLRSLIGVPTPTTRSSAQLHPNQPALCRPRARAPTPASTTVMDEAATRSTSAAQSSSRKNHRVAIANKATTKSVTKSPRRLPRNKGAASGPLASKKSPVPDPKPNANRKRLRTNPLGGCRGSPSTRPTKKHRPNGLHPHLLRVPPKRPANATTSSLTNSDKLNEWKAIWKLHAVPPGTIVGRRRPFFTNLMAVPASLAFQLHMRAKYSWSGRCSDWTCSTSARRQRFFFNLSPECESLPVQKLRKSNALWTEKALRFLRASFRR